MLSYSILPSQKATLLLIPYHFTIPPTSQKSIFIKILFFNLSLLFLSNRYFFQTRRDSIFLGFPTVFFFLSLPQPLALVQHIEPHTQTHDTPINLSKPITTHTHTQTQTQTIKPSTKPHTQTKTIKPSTEPHTHKPSN